MTVTNPSATAVTVGTKPGDDETDIFGLTHLGNVRKTNQDHFLICSLQRQITLHGTSLPDASQLEMDPGRFALLAMVADGVGAGEKGGEASKRAMAGITKYVWNVLHTYYTADSSDDDAFRQALEETALHVHREIEEHAESDPELRGMATTLTFWIGVWPKAYLVQVGDSRFYVLRGDQLVQLSRDQTIAEEFFEQGIFNRTDADSSPLKHHLTSSMGGPQSAPLVISMEQNWNNVGLLCSDGLTKHVSDERIRHILMTMTSAKQAAEALLQEALDDGGSDNITIIVGRAVQQN